MTIFGPDISSFEAGLDLSKLTAAAFVIAKTTEGTYYTDADYQGWRRQCASIGKPFVWYHFLTTQDVHAQVQHLIANVGDASLPGMLDVEPQDQTGSRPDFAQVLAFVTAARSAGLNLKLVYLPHWYWEQIGSPDLTPLSRAGLGLVSSSYPGGSGPAPRLYPGDGAAGWQPYGGVTPLLYQYTNQGSDGGMTMDYSAFRGSPAQLAAFLQTASTGGNIVGTIPASIGQKWPGIASEFPAGGTFDDETALIYADAGAREAARAANATWVAATQATAAVNALAAKMGVPVAVDVAGLAAALGPLLHPTTDVDALAGALVPHLPGAPDPAAFAEALIAHIKVV